jgi:hypothetical protein
VDSFHGGQSKNLIPEFVEEGSLKGLCKVVSHHLLSRAVLHGNLFLSYSIGDNEIPNVYVSGTVASGGFAIFFELHGALVVLKQHAGAAISLRFEEVLGPEDLRQDVVRAHQLGFRRAFCVHFLFL